MEGKLQQLSKQLLFSVEVENPDATLIIKLFVS